MATFDEQEIQAELRRYGILKEDIDFFNKNRDQLKEQLQKTRRNLLATSLLALVVGRTNLVPVKINALGISFNSVQQTYFRFILAAVVIYFLFVFTHQLFRLSFYDSLYSGTNRAISEARERLGRREDGYNGARIFYLGKISRSLGQLVEILIPYFVALLGIGSVFKLLPNWLFFGVM
jgi:hypothetical protein